MPKTFRDAIIVTRKLGLEYIWIDSLCIIQDLGGDWLIEAPKMEPYYSDALITIAADCTDGDSNGFLQTRRAGRQYISGHHKASNTIYADEVAAFELEESMGIRCLHLKDVSWDGEPSNPNPIKDLPLQKQAWTLQERYLSKNVVHFGLEQNYLGLNELSKVVYEDGREAHNDSLFWSKLYDRDDALPFQSWYSAIEDYMQRNITYKSDILPALSGVVQVVSRLSGDTYRARL
jgi:Heterokaryon incompatibility protein (HET)